MLDSFIHGYMSHLVVSRIAVPLTIICGTDAGLPSASNPPSLLVEAWATRFLRLSLVSLVDSMGSACYQE